MQFHDFSKGVEILQSKTALTVFCNDWQYKAVLVTDHEIFAGAWQPRNNNLGHLAICRDASQWYAMSHVYISYDNKIGDSNLREGISYTD